MKTPNLFIAGLPRSGTSSLHRYLNQHPDIFMTSIKEPNYFAQDFHEESDRFHKKQLYFPYRANSDYLRLYRRWKQEKIAGEASWTNLYSKDSACNICRFNPQAKIIITFREPTAFLYSFHSAALFALGETIEDFQMALAAETERKNGNRLGKRVIVPSWLYYSEFIHYVDHAQRFLSIFDPQQIIIILFDDLISKTDVVYKNILNFLQVDTSFTPKFEVVNPNKQLKWPRLKKWVLDSPYFRKTIRFLGKDEIYVTLKNLYKNKIVIYKQRSPLKDEIKYELMVKYKPEVEKLSDLLQRNLVSLWGYDKM